MRRVIRFPCDGDMLTGTLDVADGRAGLLIVSGGNEIRAGAHRGMALLAQRLAGRGVPVFRYDRRGIGDSEGTNRGFEESAADIAAAAGAFRAHADIDRLVAFGNCDAASALALFHAGAGVDAVILSNPWVGKSGDDDLPQAAAIRAHYAERLRKPREWLRLMRGGVDLRKLASGVSKLVRSRPEENPLIARMAGSLRASEVPVTVLLVTGDNTAIAFEHAWRKSATKTDARVERLKSTSHSYAGREDKDWLFEQLAAGLSR